MWTVTLHLSQWAVTAICWSGDLALPRLAGPGRQPAPGPGCRRRPAPGAPGPRRGGRPRSALGGWVSSNYAAPPAPISPTCHGVWRPDMDFATAFTLHRTRVLGAAGTLLSPAPRSLPSTGSRLGAAMVACCQAGFRLRPSGTPGVAGAGGLAARPCSPLLALQIGIANVLLLLAPAPGGGPQPGGGGAAPPPPWRSICACPAFTRPGGREAYRECRQSRRCS